MVILLGNARAIPRARARRAGGHPSAAIAAAERRRQGQGRDPPPVCGACPRWVGVCAGARGGERCSRGRVPMLESVRAFGDCVSEAGGGSSCDFLGVSERPVLVNPQRTPTRLRHGRARARARTPRGRVTRSAWCEVVSCRRASCWLGSSRASWDSGTCDAARRHRTQASASECDFEGPTRPPLGWWPPSLLAWGASTEWQHEFVVPLPVNRILFMGATRDAVFWVMGEAERN